jgi:SAM-dependent methyltransferase
MTGGRRTRRNLANAAAEFWRPPIFCADTNRVQRIVSALRRFLDLQAGSLWRDLKEELSTATGTVLDVGCGAQPYRSLLPCTVRYVGIDTADAKEKFGYEMPDTMYFPGATWPIADATVDLVLCAEVIEHILEPILLLSEIKRCLKPDGRLVLTVPFSARWHFIPYDYYRYTPAGLNHLLTTAGFSDIRIVARGNPLTVACYKGMALILPLLIAPRSGVLAAGIARMVGLAASPFLLVLAGIANLTLGMDWGEDCLGYTATAIQK